VLVDRGKGAHGQAGYVQESTWNAWNGERFGAYRLAATIRAMKRPQPANVRPAGGDEAAAATRQPPSGDAAPPPGDATFGEKLIEAAKEAREIAQGKREPASVYLPPEWRSVDGGVDW
jgi:hypothetical protein